ncbi:uncharacterized protein LOC111056072 isoform X2 [Nilaparvata lugens]|uniref:uncharacterized protein LOC111056072 isoform X2 n=1 Tax=Nilaparvata lugens TaxID=108931 RepID=UPI00193DE0D1|nr:uncharacterized protein LOC111056072 isoform X2 [Nilaparvata lugens]
MQGETNLEEQFTDGYELVRRNWIRRETSECYWPDVLSTKHYDRAVEAMEDPKPSWKTFCIKKIIARAKSFGRGKEKLKEAATRSDLSMDADNAMMAKITRHSRAIKRPYTSSSSECNDDDDDDDDNPIPPLPKIPDNITQEKVPKRSVEEPPVKNRKKRISIFKFV